MFACKKVVGKTGFHLYIVLSRPVTKRGHVGKIDFIYLQNVCEMLCLNLLSARIMIPFFAKKF